MNLSEKDIEQPSSALAPPPSPWKTRTEFSLHSPMTPWSTTSLDSSATLIPSPSPASFKTQRPSPLQQAYLKEGIRSQQRRREVSVYGSMMHRVSGGMEGGGFGSVLRPSAVGEVHGRLEDRKYERGENEGSTQKRHEPPMKYRAGCNFIISGIPQQEENTIVDCIENKKKCESTSNNTRRVISQLCQDG